jgi:hypothetical protein
MAVMDFVQLKGGESINGIVDVKVFTIKGKYGTLRIPKKEIMTIQYKNSPYVLSDEIKTSAGTRYEGDILPAVVPVRFEGGNQVLKIPKQDIVAIMLFGGALRPLSAATRRKLAGVR